MAYIKTLKDNELIGGQDNTDVYPITSTQAVYSQKKDGSAPKDKKVLLEERLTDIENQIYTPIGTDDIVDEAIVTRKIADNAITTSKIDNGAVTSEKIASNAVTNDKIANGTITGDKFTDDSIDGSKIKDNSVPGSKLADGAIESIDLQDNTLSGSKLADNSVDGDKLVDGAVTSAKLKDNSIDGSKIADSTIQSLDIKDGTISGAKLVNGTITNDKLADGSIDNNKIVNNTITGDKFLDESISGEKIQANTIHGSKLETGTVDGADIIAGTLNGNKIADMSVDGDKLADDSIETRHIKSNTISGSKIVTNSIDGTKIRNNSLIGENFEEGVITTAKIADGAVTNSKIADNTIASDKIADGAITTAKLANGSIGGTSIADNAITNAKLQDNSIVNRNIATGTLTGDKFVDNTITGDKIIDNTIPGSKIKDGTIENVDIKDNTLSGAKLVDNSISGSKIADNAITSAHLLDNSIPASKIQDGTIESIDIKDGTLDGSKIKDNTVTGAKLSDGVISSDKIENNSITTDKIANLAISENKIANGVVTENKLGIGSVTTDKIVDNAVTTNKLADENVTTAKLADGAVTEDKLADGAITPDKIADSTITELQTIMDQVPTQNSGRPVMSGGVYEALTAKQNIIDDLSTIRSGAADGATAIQPDDEDYTELQEQVAYLNATAVKTGSYDATVAVGLADNLRGDTVVNAEFYRRKTGGTQNAGSGIASIKEVKGKSIVWNQLLRTQNASKKGVTVTAGLNGDITFNGTATEAILRTDYLSPIQNFEGSIGRKYYIGAFNTNNKFNIQFIGLNYTGAWQILSPRTIINPSNGIFKFSITIDTDTSFDNEVYKMPNIIDLTLMFGNGNEPSSAADFEKMFPLDYYDYNAGKVIPFAGQNFVTIGKNQYNPTSGKANLLGSQTYQLLGTYTSATIDEVAVILDSNNCFTTTEDCVLDVTGGNDTDTFVGLYKDETNTYEPYEKHTLPLNPSQWRDKDGNLVFPYNGMHGIGNVYDYAKVDADGYIRKAVRVIQEVDLSNKTWRYSSKGKPEINDGYCFVLRLGTSIKYGNVPGICSKYEASQNASKDKQLDISTWASNDGIIVYDSSYTDAITFGNAMQGVMLYLPLITPVEVELATPIYAKYLVDKDGTEEITPANSTTPYTAMANLSILYAMDVRGEIKNLPKNYLSKESAETMFNDYYTKSEVNTALGNKQDTISDLATIRSGASSGAAAYQKPINGIPRTDLDNSVQTSLNKADTALQQHQDISGKEDVTTIIAPVNTTDATLPITTLTCEVGKYYRIGVAVDTLGITLPTITDLTTVKTVVIYLTAGTTPAITISSSDSKDVYYQDGFEIEAGSTYEINALFNGAAWIVASVKINVE